MLEPRAVQLGRAEQRTLSLRLTLYMVSQLHLYRRVETYLLKSIAAISNAFKNMQHKHILFQIFVFSSRPYYDKELHTQAARTKHYELMSQLLFCCIASYENHSINSAVAPGHLHSDASSVRKIREPVPTAAFKASVLSPNMHIKNKKLTKVSCLKHT